MNNEGIDERMLCQACKKDHPPFDDCAKESNEGIEEITLHICKHFKCSDSGWCDIVQCDKRDEIQQIIQTVCQHYRERLIERIDNDIPSLRTMIGCNRKDLIQIIQDVLK